MYHLLQNHPAVPTIRRRLILSLMALPVLGVMAPAPAGAGLTVVLTDGTRLAVDRLMVADAAGLTLAADAPGASVSRTLPWSRIAAADLDGTAYTAAELRLAAVGCEVPSPMPPAPCPPLVAGCVEAACVEAAWLPPPWLPPRRATVIGVRRDPLAAYADLIPGAYPAGIPASEAGFALAVLRERRRLGLLPAAPGLVPPWGVEGPAYRGGSAADGVLEPQPWGLDPRFPILDPLPVAGSLSRVELRAAPVRTGGGADVNALAVELLGFDAAGRPVPVVGTANFTLAVPRQTMVRVTDDLYVPRPVGLPDASGDAARWTRTLSAGASEGPLLLPLPGPTPEHDPTAAPSGTLRASVLVPGVGLFAANTPPLPLRPADPFRDALRATTGSRFLPSERTTDRPRTDWPRQIDRTGATPRPAR